MLSPIRLREAIIRNKKKSKETRNNREKSNIAIEKSPIFEGKNKMRNDFGAIQIFQYCDSNIGLYPICPCKVIAFYLHDFSAFSELSPLRARKIDNYNGNKYKE